MVPLVATRKTHQRLQEFSAAAPKGLLQGASTPVLSPAPLDRDRQEQEAEAARAVPR